MGSSEHHTVLIAGLTRSGSTWVSQALGHCRDASVVHEPDNDRLHSEAIAAKAELGRYPVLAGTDRAPAYGQLFRAACTGSAQSGARRRHLADRLVAGGDPMALEQAMVPPGRWTWRLAVARRLTAVPIPVPPAAGRRIVKSVHCPFALEWLVDAVRPDAVAVIVRHPASVIRSWRSLGWSLDRFPWKDEKVWDRYGPPEPERPPLRAPATFVERGAWQFSLVATALVTAAERRGWLVVDHDDVLAAPVDRLEEAAARLGLEWTDRAGAWVQESDRPGEGYELSRVHAEQRSRWRDRLPPEEMATVEKVVGRFPAIAGRWPLR
jgi:hypothetical protein